MFNKVNAENCTSLVQGLTTKFSLIRENGYRLPIAEYEVNGQKYEVRLSFDVTKYLYDNTKTKKKFVLVPHSGLTFEYTNLIGLNVNVYYNPENPSEAITKIE